MSNASKYQRDYWFTKVAEYQRGEYCKGCGISKDSNWLNHPFTGLRVDKINNDGNHTITDNEVTDFQLLCISCNRIKNPSKRPDDYDVLQQTSSERKNLSAEKPLMQWLFKKLQDGENITWDYFVAEGSFEFDVSPYTIETRYFKKYFKAPSAPFEVYLDRNIGIDGTSMIRIKEEFLRKLQKSNLDIVLYPHTMFPIIKNEN